MHQAAKHGSTAQQVGGYERRRPEETLLYQVIEQHWPQFLEGAEAQGGLPRFVVREFEEYLRCGILEHGLVQLACRGCGQELVVGFSCKRRGFCPSCLGRRMADVAAHLVDEVLPEVPMRQWVCSLPWRVRVLVGYDRRLCRDVLDAFSRSLLRSLRRRAKRELGLSSVNDAHVGAVTFVSSAHALLALALHLLCPDSSHSTSGGLAFVVAGQGGADKVRGAARLQQSQRMRASGANPS